MKEVYIYNKTNEISFTYIRNECVCFGETDATLEDFLAWMLEDWLSRGLDISDLPTIKVEDA